MYLEDLLGVISLYCTVVYRNNVVCISPWRAPCWLYAYQLEGGHRCALLVRVIRDNALMTGALLRYPGTFSISVPMRNVAHHL